MDNKELFAMLSAPFADSDLEWRLQWTDLEKKKGTAVPYVTNRAIQNRLDSVVGVDGWKNEYLPWHGDGKKSSQLCGISVWIAERGEWLTKYDGAEDSDIESVKGGLSDSMKRAAVQWGIGRYLYSMSTEFVKLDTQGKTPKIDKDEYAKLNKAHQEVIAKMFPSGKAKDTPSESAVPAKQDTPKQTPPPKAPTPASPPKGPAKAVPGVYTVLKVVKAASVKRDEGDMNLQMQDGGGNIIQAFCVGFNPAVVPGVTLTDCEIEKRIRDEVVFYILKKYKVADVKNAA
jgi:hypothetical protein